MCRAHERAHGAPHRRQNADSPRRRSSARDKIGRVEEAAIRANGTVFKSMRMFASRNYGEPAVERCLYALAPAERELLTSASAVGWYPVGAVFRFLRAVDRNCGAGDLKLCH